MSRFALRDEADADVDDIAAHIARDNLKAALRFYDCVWADFERLATMPGIGQRRRLRNPALKGLRSLPVTGYRNYLIFYLPLADGIEVVRVMHGARDVDRILDRS